MKVYAYNTKKKVWEIVELEEFVAGPYKTAQIGHPSTGCVRVAVKRNGLFDVYHEWSGGKRAIARGITAEQLRDYVLDNPY